MATRTPATHLGRRALQHVAVNVNTYSKPQMMSKSPPTSKYGANPLPTYRCGGAIAESTNDVTAAVMMTTKLHDALAKNHTGWQQITILLV